MDGSVTEQLETMRERLEWTEEHMKALEEENEQLRAALADMQALAELAYNEANRGYLQRLLGW